MDDTTTRTAPDRLSSDAAAPFLATVHRRWLVEGDGAPWRRRSVSLVAAQIEGLTPLWHQLLVEGIGGQELTDLLDAGMGRLLDLAGAHGGDLLEHSGGHLLLAFEGPGHERRATQAASALPAALAGLPVDPVAAPLVLSAGVATGDLDLFLVGGDHRELVACGPLVSRVVGLEQRARAGEVLADGSTAAAVNDARWSDAGHGGHLLVLAPPPSTVGLGIAQADIGGGAADLRNGIPVGLRRQLGSGGCGAAQVLALAVVEVVGVDDLLASHGHGALADALHMVVCSAQAACARHRTTFVASQGGPNHVRFTLAAGIPEPGVDDVGRLLLTARAVAAVDCGLLLRVGVSHGEGFVAEVGSKRRRVAMVLTSVVPDAGHLVERGDAGSVVASDRALLAARIRFAATNLAPFQVPGAAEPALASLVGPPLDPGLGSATTCPLVGRDEERDALLAALQDVRDGAPRTVIVSGPAGIGRSRLLAEVAGAAPDLPRLVIAGGEDVGGPFADVSPALRHLLAVAPDANDDAVVEALRSFGGPACERWLPLVALPFGVALVDTAATTAVEPRSRRARIHALTAQLLRPVLAARAVVIIDDVARLGSASAALLRDLAAAFSGAPWLVILSGQEVDPAPLDAQGPVLHIGLGPLHPEAAAALLHADGCHPIPPDLVDAVVTRAGGNPLLLHELQAMVLSGADVPEDLPATLEDAVVARFEQLSGAARAQLNAAALLGARAPVQVLAGMSPDGVSGALAELLEADRPGWVRFRHWWIQALACAGLSAHRRRRVHGQLTDLLEAMPSFTGRAELLAEHATAARSWPTALRWSQVAAATASAAGTASEAAAFLHRAVHAARQLDVPATLLSELYERLADAEGQDGQRAEAARSLAQARRLAGDDRLRVAHLLGQHGRLCEDTGDHAAARRWFTRGIQALDAGSPTSASELVRVELMLGLAQTYARQDRIGEAADLLEEAVVDADALGHRQAATAGRELLAELRHQVLPTR